MMKICYFADARPIRGPHLAGWARHLAAMGNEVHVISFKPAEIENVTVHCLDLQGTMSKGTLYISLASMLMKAKRIIQRISPDIMHGWDLGGSGFCAALMGFHPLVLTAYGWDVLFLPRRSIGASFMLRFALSRADAVASISSYLAEELRRYAPAKLRMDVVSWPVDVHRFVPAQRTEKDGPPVIGYTKRLEWYYGVNYLIDALPLITKVFPETQLWLFGEGSYKEQLRQQVKLMGMKDNVKFMGWVSHDLMRKYLNDIDVVVIPSLSESFGVAALEAQAAAIPVVASSIGGLREVVMDGQTGFLVPPRNSLQIAEKVLHLLRDPRLRRRMGEEGRRFVIDNYSREVCGSKMLKLYESLIRGVSS